jgi:hypothetical protein
LRDAESSEETAEGGPTLLSQLDIGEIVDLTEEAGERWGLPAQDLPAVLELARESYRPLSVSLRSILTSDTSAPIPSIETAVRALLDASAEAIYRGEGGGVPLDVADLARFLVYGEQ